MKPSALQYRLHDSIHEIEESQWDRLAPRDQPLATHRFVRLCEDSAIEKSIYRHVMVYDHQGLAATATLCCMNAPLDALAPGFIRKALHVLRGGSPRFMSLPVVFCGLPVSLGQAPLTFRQDTDRPAVLVLIDQLMHEFASETGSSTLVFKEFSMLEECAEAALVERGYLKLPSLPYHELALDWDSFEEYLLAMRSGYRRQVRQIREKASIAGLTIERLDDYGIQCRCLHDLYLQVMQATDNWLEKLPLTFFERLSRTFNGNTHALLMRHEGSVVASAILLSWGHSITFLLAGIDQQFNRKMHVYPHLLACVVADAIESRAAVLNLGQTSDFLKSRFGSSTISRCIFLRHRKPAAHWLISRSSGILFPDKRTVSRRVFAAEKGGWAATC